MIRLLLVDRNIPPENITLLQKALFISSVKTDAKIVVSYCCEVKQEYMVNRLEGERVSTSHVRDLELQFQCWRITFVSVPNIPSYQVSAVSL